MRRDHDGSSDQIEFGGVFRMLKRRLPRLLLWSLAFGAVAYAAMLLVSPRYESEAQIEITARSGWKLPDPKRDVQNAEAVAVRMDKEAVNTHVRALLSPDLALEIADRLALKDKAEFNSRLGPTDAMDSLFRLVGIGAPRASETDEDRVLTSFFRKVEVYPAKETRVIGVRVSSSDPQLAAEIANLLVEKYRALLASRTVAETDEALRAIEPKIQSLTSEVAAAERGVEAFRGEANIFKGGQQATGLNEQQLAELTAELSKAQAARSEAEARARSAHEMMKAGGADAVPDVQRSPLIQNLVQQRIRVERQISELSATLLPAHPRMQQLNADLAGLKKQINGEVAKIIDGVDKEARVAALREDSLNKSLAEIKARIVTASPDEVRLRQLENDAKTKRDELERLKSQYEANRVAGDSRSVPVEVQIITRASASSVPVFPKKGAFAALVATSVFILGLALNIAAGVMTGARVPARSARDRARGRGERVWDEDIEREILVTRPEPSLAAPPQVVMIRAEMDRDPPPRAIDGTREAKAPPAPAPAVLSEAVAPLKPVQPEAQRAAEASPQPATLESFAGQLLAARSGTSGLRTLVTGEDDDIVPAAEALALARSLSSTTTTLIVDWSPSGFGMSADLGVRASPGINELLDGTASFEDIVTGIPGTIIQVISSGRPIGSRETGLDADRINLVLDALDEAYEQIVVVARRPEARELFETIEGRFDAGIEIAESFGDPSQADDDAGDSFLGFEVLGIETARFERPVSAPQRTVPAHRLARAVGMTHR